MKKTSVLYVVFMLCLSLFSCNKQELVPQQDLGITDAPNPTEAPLPADQKVLYVLSKNQSIYVIKNLNAVATQNKAFGAVSAQLSCVEPSYEAKKIFFGVKTAGNGLSKGIYKINEDGTGKELVVATSSPVAKIAVDKANKRVFWIERLSENPISTRVMSMIIGSGVAPKQIAKAASIPLHIYYITNIEVDEPTATLWVSHAGGSIPYEAEVDKYSLTGSLLEDNFMYYWGNGQMRIQPSSNYIFGFGNTSDYGFIQRKQKNDKEPSFETIVRMTDGTKFASGDIDFATNTGYFLRQNPNFVQIYSYTLPLAPVKLTLANLKQVITFPGSGVQVEGRFDQYMENYF